MRIRIHHETTYRYEQPVRALVQLMRLTPRDHDGQHVLRWRIDPSADGRVRLQEDSLGNVMHLFSADGTVEEVSIRVFGEVETNDTHGLVRGAVERVPDLFYLRDTDLAQADTAIRAFADASMEGAGGDALAALHGLLEALNREVTFDTAPTQTTTTAAQAFALRRGVCQDLTHIFIAAARHRGIPARYVSGYFLRADGVIDQEAGHAWVEAKVPDLGWVGFDPTNGISISDAHVRVAVGLDYLGAAPIRGSRMGGGTEELGVKLRIDHARSHVQA